MGRTLDGPWETLRERTAKSPEGFKDPRGLSNIEKTKQFAQKDLSKQNTDQAVKELQDRIVHLESQLEFLKKFLISGNRWKKLPKTDGKGLCCNPA